MSSKIWLGCDGCSHKEVCGRLPAPTGVAHMIAEEIDKRQLEWLVVDISCDAYVSQNMVKPKKNMLCNEE